MFHPDLERFKKKYDEGFDFKGVVRELLLPEEERSAKKKKEEEKK